MPTWICLLRGVNLGARNKVNMAALRDALTTAGLSEVRTHLQSGNVIVRSAVRTPDKVAGSIGDLLRDRFSLDVPVIVRTPQQLRDLLAWCPFRKEAAEHPATVHLLHLTARPDPDRLPALTGQDWEPDKIAIAEHDVAISYATSMHHSRLQHGAVLRRLGVDGTARNWRTVQALVDLTAAE
ncbi:DUF1697 domain-containing protein [Microlunatus soli]|uniref:Uncharacterized conserved protein, DUF1697 family n=1 Tax=Microlunatus soli TaxID=630515 RepID=A0A1H1NHD2_9ACTN|nr:DUF1697 domain-containing protein [Microlunatus soli]SDR98388.1 Uncharacterized conserved protein, DUF1697 family [Microlunatus soli]